MKNKKKRLNLYKLALHLAQSGSKRGNIFFIKGKLFLRIIKYFPPYLDQNTSEYPLDTLYNIAIHLPTKTLIIANKGASLLCKTPLSNKNFILFHVGLIIYHPKHGIEIADTGIVGNILTSKKVIVRTESACSPSFIFNSQRCNCYDQWKLMQELAGEFNTIDVPKINAQELERKISSYYQLNSQSIPVTKNSNQAFILVHLSSQNGMGSGAIENTFVDDLTTNAFIRHRAEYSAEQIHQTSMAGGFKAIGLIPDPRKTNFSFAYKITAIILDYFNAPKQVALFTNNKEKIRQLKKAGYLVERQTLLGRVDRASSIELRDRKKEYNHLIPNNIKKLKINDELDCLLYKLRYEKRKQTCPA